MRQVLHTPEAEDDLMEFWLYIALDNPDAADRVLDAIEQKAQYLLTHPELGGKRDELAAGLRSLIVGSHIVFYRIFGNDIEIARVLHGARDIERLFH